MDLKSDGKVTSLFLHSNQTKIILVSFYNLDQMNDLSWLQTPLAQITPIKISFHFILSPSQRCLKLLLEQYQALFNLISYCRIPFLSPIQYILIQFLNTTSLGRIYLS